MSNCGCKRYMDPAGIWDFQNMIGAQVKVKSMPISNFSSGIMASDTYTIGDIYFRVSLDGKTITIIRLRELPDLFFTWKDLEVIKTMSYGLAITGNFKVGMTIAGYGEMSEEDEADSEDINVLEDIEEDDDCI
jgi:hypothetical protein